MGLPVLLGRNQAPSKLYEVIRTSNAVENQLTSDDSGSADEDEARGDRKFGSESEVDQVSNTGDIWLERRKAQVKIHSPA